MVELTNESKDKVEEFIKKGVLLQDKHKYFTARSNESLVELFKKDLGFESFKYFNAVNYFVNREWGDYNRIKEYWEDDDICFVICLCQNNGILLNRDIQKKKGLGNTKSTRDKLIDMDVICELEITNKNVICFFNPEFLKVANDG